MGPTVAEVVAGVVVVVVAEAVVVADAGVDVTAKEIRKLMI